MVFLKSNPISSLGVTSGVANPIGEPNLNFNIFNSKNWEVHPAFMCAVSAASLVALCAVSYGISRWASYFFKIHSAEVVETVASTVGKKGEVLSSAMTVAEMEPLVFASVVEESAVGRIVSAEVICTEEGFILKDFAQVQDAMRIYGAGWLGTDTQLAGEILAQDIMKDHGYGAAQLMKWSQAQGRQNIGRFVDDLLLQMEREVKERGVFNLSLSPYQGVGPFANCSIHLRSITAGEDAYFLNIRAPSFLEDSQKFLREILNAKPMMQDLHVLAEIETADPTTFTINFETIRRRLAALFPHLEKTTGANIAEYFFYNPNTFYRYPLFAERGMIVTMQPIVPRDYRFIYETGEKVRDQWIAEGAILKGSRVAPWNSAEALPSSLKISVETAGWDEIYDTSKYSEMMHLAKQIKMALMG